jgi:homoisocitrate dehydrogenase
MFRVPFRSFSMAARQTLKIGLIPADGIGKEVIPVSFVMLIHFELYSHKLQAAREAIIALGSDIPKPEFIDLVAGWECFTRTGVALPEDTVQ